MNNLALYIKAFFDRYIYFVPIIMLLATLVTNFVDYSNGVYNYVVIGNSFGYSLISNTAMFCQFNFTHKKYCWLTRNAPIGLILVNLVDICGFFLYEKVYSFIFNIAICSIIITLALMFYLKRQIPND